MAFNAEKYLQLTEKTYFKQLGKVVKIVGLTIESVGPDAKINDHPKGQNFEIKIQQLL